MKKFYITTPIYYVNDVPHIGHVYSTIVADVLARWHRMQGERVYFTTGTDENAEKNAEVALQQRTGDSVQGTDREVVQQYVDTMSAKWQVTWDELGFSHDDFFRTTLQRHIVGVKKFFDAVRKKGDIYTGKYVGLYCTGCEAYVTESDLVLGKCPLHKKAPKRLEEENYFFRASRYKQQLLDHIATHPEFVQPVSRRNEIIQYIEHHFDDFSISRQSLHWGIPVPSDPSQTIYVWFDALIYYLTTLDYGGDEKKYKQFWPPDLQIVGKDIIKFHCALWPAMLLSAGLPLPKTVFAHGFFTINGQKISKSLGNAIDPVDLAETYSVDAVRYFLLREIPFGEDGDFSIERLAARYDADLANGIGNLTARVVTLAEKSSVVSCQLSATHTPFAEKSKTTWDVYEKALNEYRFHDALATVWDFIAACDGYIEKEKPWQSDVNGQVSGVVIPALLESLRHIAWWLWPVMPETAEGILSQLGILEQSRGQKINEAKTWGGAEFHVKKGAVLFPRLNPKP